MANSIKPEQLGAAIKRELTLYCEQVTEGVNAAGAEAMERLVSMTKATAPKGARGSFRRHITSSEQPTGYGSKEYIWHVKAPDYRLTHLLVHGHATRNGGRTKANPFLANACDTVLPEYEHNVEEAIRNGG